MINKTEFTIDYNQLCIIANHWKCSDFYRFYLPDAHPKIEVFISQKKDRKGRYGVKLNNGYLYLDKSYDNLLYHVDSVIEYLIESHCVMGDISNIEVPGPAESKGPMIVDIVYDLVNEIKELKKRVRELEENK